MKKVLISLFIILSVNLQAQEAAQKAFSQGVKFLQADAYAKAEKQFSIAIKKGKVKEGLKMSYIYRAFAYNGQEAYEKALRDFNRAIKLDDQDAASFIDRGICYLSLREHEQAIDDFNRALEIDSTDKYAEAAYYHLGKVYTYGHQTEKAILYLNLLVELAPTDAEAYFLRAIAKGQQRDWDASIADYDLAIKHQPNYTEAYANRGVQKLNRLPTNEKIGKDIDCLEDPCSDLLKAREMGDQTVGDMIYLYCKKCQ